MKIVEFTAENVKRLRAVYITPAPHVQVIAGRNAQGKSSVLDAIWLALGGGAASRETVRPIRDGETSAHVRLDLGDLVVTRTWTGDKTALAVTSAEGARFSSPQKMLDDLIGRLSFDPLGFTRLSAREQVAALLDLVDLDVDLDALAIQRQRLYDERTEVGRQAKAIGEIPALVDGVPDEEVSSSTILAELRAAQEVARRSDEVARGAERAQSAREQAEAALEAARVELERTLVAETAAYASIRALPEVPDVAEIERRLTTVEDTNRRVRANADAHAKAARHGELYGRYSGLSDQIAALDRSKADALAKAAFPVPGLSFDESGVIYQGLPFSQASAAEQIRVSLAMAMALNPRLRVVRILDGSLLDADNLALIEAMAAEHDYQVWIERVGNGDGIGVVIEDGAVA